MQVALAVGIGGVWGSPARLVSVTRTQFSWRPGGWDRAGHRRQCGAPLDQPPGRWGAACGSRDCRAVKLLSTQIVDKTGERSKASRMAVSSHFVWVRAAVLECFPTLRMHAELRNWRTKGENTPVCNLLIHRNSKPPRECCSLKNIDCGNRVHHGRKKRPVATEIVRPPTNTSRICTSFSSCVAVARA